MTTPLDKLRTHLRAGPQSAKYLMGKLKVSQPTISRMLTTLAEELTLLRDGRTVLYALKDESRGMADTPVYQVDAQGKLSTWGMLISVHPEGFVMQQTDGVAMYHEGLPWWLLDALPQGFVGQTYAQTHGKAMGLPAKLAKWQPLHHWQALCAHHLDGLGHVLLGDEARSYFLNHWPTKPIAASQVIAHYAHSAAASSQTDVATPPHPCVCGRR